MNNHGCRHLTKRNRILQSQILPPEYRTKKIEHNLTMNTELNTQWSLTQLIVDIGNRVIFEVAASGGTLWLLVEVLTIRRSFLRPNEQSQRL